MERDRESDTMNDQDNNNTKKRRNDQIENNTLWTIYGGSTLKDKLSNTITHLKFTGEFNHLLETGSLPKNLTHFVLDNQYNQPIRPGVLPASLKEITFGQSYNHLILSTVLPPNLEKLTLHKDYKFRFELMRDIIQNYTYRCTLSWSDDNVHFDILS